ncbi:hypothetical protein KEJ34_09015 [Candidatus Bathyarchaeota archaeon]|nr:hypothetical protein [Candidatus Bathyarchaeota archaeon]
MFKFGRNQEIFEVGGVKIGGQPGELPLFWLEAFSTRGTR